MLDGSDTFGCALCGQRQHYDLLCREVSAGVVQLCVYCCQCDLHGSQEVEGTVVWTARHGWRGLQDSPSSMRRQA